jgi:hypothetical protein
VDISGDARATCDDVCSICKRLPSQCVIYKVKGFWCRHVLWFVVVLSWELEGRREGGGGRWLVVGGRRGGQVVVPSRSWCQVCPLILIYYYKYSMRENVLNKEEKSIVHSKRPPLPLVAAPLSLTVSSQTTWHTRRQ